MSWAAHELESYLIQKHVKARVSYLAVLTGCLLPDLFTKLPVYGFSLAFVHLQPEAEPWRYHRGWPGVGFTHSLTFGILFATAVLLITRSRSWFLGLLIGSAAHVLTDVFDSVGTMALFPFTSQHYSIGMWAYASQEGRYGDAAAYYSSLGGVWDVFWLCLVGLGWRALGAEFFFTRVVPSDGAWTWLRRRLSLSDTALLAIYRAYFVYGAARIFAWFSWARLREHAALDWTWGGPFWVDKASTHYGTLGGLALRTLLGAAGLTAFCVLGWLLLGRRLWRRGRDPHPPARTAPMPVERRADLLTYLAAGLSLAALGFWLTTPILNWIVGPAYVIGFVLGLTRLRAVLARRRSGGPDPRGAGGRAPREPAFEPG